MCQQGHTKQDESPEFEKYEPFSKNSKFAGGGGFKKILQGIFSVELNVDSLSQNTSFQVIKDLE